MLSSFEYTAGCANTQNKCPQSYPQAVDGTYGAGSSGWSRPVAVAVRLCTTVCTKVPSD